MQLHYYYDTATIHTHFFIVLEARGGGAVLLLMAQCILFPLSSAWKTFFARLNTSAHAAVCMPSKKEGKKKERRVKNEKTKVRTAFHS